MTASGGEVGVVDVLAAASHPLGAAGAPPSRKRCVCDEGEPHLLPAIHSRDRCMNSHFQNFRLTFNVFLVGNDSTDINPTKQNQHQIYPNF